MNDPVADLQRLTGIIAPLGRILIAFSGGVDSTLVLKVAHDVLGEGALAVTAVSPSLAAAERADARRLASWIGARHCEIETFEHLDPGYRANAGDRCYHCKSELYERLAHLAEKEGFCAIADGTHAGDLTDVRPGLRAAREHAVIHPLAQAGLDKSGVRRLSLHLGLPSWDKPEMACLASRLPQGTPVSVARLRRAERAESAVKALGFRQVRVRDEGEWARVEVGVDELERVADPDLAARLSRDVCAAGFAEARIDPRGYRRGGAGKMMAIVDDDDGNREDDLGEERHG